MPITTIQNKFPLLPRPYPNEKWEGWADRLITILDGFFATNPYAEKFPKASFADSVLQFQFSTSGSAATSVQSITVDTDGRPLSLFAHSHLAIVASASASSIVRLELVRQGNATSVAIAQLDNTMSGVGIPFGFVSLAANDTPNPGKYIYQFRVSVINTTPNSSDFRLRNRFIIAFDKPDK
jgi:hypothetical protein